MVSVVYLELWDAADLMERAPQWIEDLLAAEDGEVSADSGPITLVQVLDYRSPEMDLRVPEDLT